MLAEICADGDFNANLHPRLLPTELVYPTSESPAQDGQLRVADLVVAESLGASGLELRDARTGDRVMPIDLCFQTPLMRPPLYQLLLRFSPPSAFGVLVPEEPWVGPAPTPPVIYRPRISLDGRIVIARRRWTVAPGAFPTQGSAESGADYFYRVNVWRLAFGIPEQVYVRIKPLSAPESSDHASGANGKPVATTPDAPPDALPNDDWTGEADPEPESGAAGSAAPAPNGAAKASPARAAQASRDYIKPQYIDFANPLLVALFARMPVGLARYSVAIEERYPPQEALLRHGDNTFANEFVIQMSFREPPTIPDHEKAERLSTLVDEPSHA
jgi:hypothetical protein